MYHQEFVSPNMSKRKTKQNKNKTVINFWIFIALGRLFLFHHIGTGPNWMSPQGRRICYCSSVVDFVSCHPSFWVENSRTFCYKSKTKLNYVFVISLWTSSYLLTNIYAILYVELMRVFDRDGIPWPMFLPRYLFKKFTKIIQISSPSGVLLYIIGIKSTQLFSQYFVFFFKVWSVWSLFKGILPLAYVCTTALFSNGS